MQNIQLTPFIYLKRDAAALLAKLIETRENTRKGARYANECLDFAIADLEKAQLWIGQAAASVAEIKSGRAIND